VGAGRGRQVVGDERFVPLQPTGSIHWSWWSVLAPIWIPAAVFAFFLAVVILVYLARSGR